MNGDKPRCRIVAATCISIHRHLGYVRGAPIRLDTQEGGRGMEVGGGRVMEVCGGRFLLTPQHGEFILLPPKSAKFLHFYVFFTIEWV